MITLFLHYFHSFKCCRMTCCGMPQIMSLLKRRCRKTMSYGKNFDLLWNAPTGV
nr:hypothetical protein Itr_chr09CG16600 [Ipomoea trifida]